MIAAEKFKVANDLVFRGTIWTTTIHASEEERPIRWGVAHQMVQSHSSRFWIPIVEELEELESHVGRV
jgi:hypothetical protein